MYPSIVHGSSFHLHQLIMSLCVLIFARTFHFGQIKSEVMWTMNVISTSKNLFSLSVLHLYFSFLLSSFPSLVFSNKVNIHNLIIHLMFHFVLIVADVLLHLLLPRREKVWLILKFFTRNACKWPRVMRVKLKLK